jgi:signal transduction histidine kinase/CheY-like chemotaxis protein
MERLPLLSLDVRSEDDVLVVRQRTRRLAALCGFDDHEQTRIVTAVMAIARNALDYGGGGAVNYTVDGDPPSLFSVRVRDRGPGIPDVKAVLEGRSASPSETGMGLGILGARRLMTHFEIDSSSHGTEVLLGKNLPPARHGSAPLTLTRIRELAQRTASEPPEPPIREMQRQNQELLRALEELMTRQAELGRLNRELEDTNRGVLALYAELEERAESLRAASELKSRFLSNMTHELRTPLNSILSLSRLLLDKVDGDLSPEQETQVRFVRRSAEDLSQLVNDLLDLARIEAGKTVVRPGSFSLDAVFGALRGVMKPLVTTDAVQLVFEEPAQIPPLHTDEGKVSQVLRNLVANALKFTDRGEVRMRATPAGDGHIAISVSDTGVGIAVEDQERIFEEFTQIDVPPGQQRRKGSGLGLPLCRRLAAVLGGRVTVRSTPGQGSTFTLLLPLQYRDVRDRAVEVQPMIDRTRAPVLIVEDDPDTLFVYESYLKGSGYQVLPAPTIEDARRLMRQVRPAAIVLDVLLEGESTWLFLTELKQASDTRDIPAIVVSVIDGNQTAIALGADDFAPKPVERSWLIERLTKLSQRGRLDKVLIVDDDEASRYLLRTLISQFRFQLFEASGGVEGLALAQREKPSVIFLDLIMPDLTGFEVLERLRADPTTRDINVIVFSSKDLDSVEREHLARLTMAVMPKGQQPESTLTDIKKALAATGVMPDQEGDA